MGKLMDRLQRQLKTTNQKDAEECLKIYEHLKQTTGRVWESQWTPLVSVRFEGKYPNSIHIFSLTAMGKIFLKGLNDTTAS